MEKYDVHVVYACGHKGTLPACGPEKLGSMRLPVLCSACERRVREARKLAEAILRPRLQGPWWSAYAAATKGE